MYFTVNDNSDLSNEKSVSIRLIGEINFFSFDLLNVIEEDYYGLPLENNEFIFQLKNGIKEIYFSEFIHKDKLVNDFIPQKMTPTNENPLLVALTNSFTNLQTTEKFTTPSVTFTPLTKEMKDIRIITLCIDVLVRVFVKINFGSLSKMLYGAVNKQIIDFRKSYNYIHSDLHEKNKIRLIALHFLFQNNLLTLFLPEQEMEKEEEWCKQVSEELKLERPLQRSISIFPPKDVLERMTNNGDKLISPHLSINTTFPESRCVKGRYTYYHYLQDNFNDKGWGCAYRSLQTIVSWYVWQGWSKICIPLHKDIQMSLVKMKDKDQSFIGSRSWIGSFEINLVLFDLFKVESRIISLTKGSDLETVFDQLWEHFDDVGSPIMIGGGQLAHTILGVSKDKSSKIRLLVLDPHYTGSSKDLALILSKGWCGWKELSFWKDNLPYNICLPSRPSNF